MDPAVSPERILLREANDHAGDARGCRRAAWLAAIARVVLARGQPAVPGQQRRGRDGEDSVQRLRGRSGASAANHTPSAGSYRIRPAWRCSTAFSYRSASSSASFAKSLRSTKTARAEPWNQGGQRHLGSRRSAASSTSVSSVLARVATWASQVAGSRAVGSDCQARKARRRVRRQQLTSGCGRRILSSLHDRVPIRGSHLQRAKVGGW